VVLPLAGVQLAAWWLARHAEWQRLVPTAMLEHVDMQGILNRSAQLWWIIGGGLVLSVMGLIDDLRNLPWAPRLVIQFGVAIGLVFGAGVQATVFAPFPWIGGVLSVLWIMVLVNAFNFLDNMDSLSSGIALVRRPYSRS
jgi:UDP-GlcNAc:undecaprenyl-phosphate GlcNAc-1-phosphate transferase